MNDNQRKQIEDAIKESHEKSDNVCANGEKYVQNEYSDSSNQINNE